MNKAISLFELNQLVGLTLQTVMPDEYWVEAELSEIREVRGHCYMELVQKDELSNTPIAKASAKCWKNKWQTIQPHFIQVARQNLCPGMKILLKVYADFHEAFGFSWIVTDIDPVYSLGDMAKKRLEIIAYLKQAGVFDMQKELFLPLFARRVAVISAENAAGYGDFVRQLHDNNVGFSFVSRLFPAIMQGEGVEQSIIKALNLIHQELENFDVVAIIRGGGATSDLSGFDTLALAENVANFPIPIITGIGHDRDESILDMVSFRKAKTPTAVATMLIDNLLRTMSQIDDIQDEITAIVRHRMDVENMRLNRLSVKIPLLFSRVKEQQTHRLQRYSIQISSLLEQRLTKEHQHLQMFSEKLRPIVNQKLLIQQHRLALLKQRCVALDPQVLLKRGYSVTVFQGKAVRNAKELQAGDTLETRFEKGKIQSVVK